MSLKIKLIGLTFFLFMRLSSFAQVSVKDSVLFAGLVNIEVGAMFSGADMADRFGFHSSVGGSVLIKNRSNLLFGFSGSFLPGNQVREDDILNPLKTETGLLIGNDGLLYDPFLTLRGFMLSANVGKITPWLSKNPNSGIFVLGGLGFMQHRIGIQFDGDQLPQLSEEYVKGYDRLANGIVLSQLVGYYYSSNKSFLNFYVGFQVNQGFLQGRRDFSFDTREAENGKRFDLSYGIKAAWTLPVYEKPKEKFYYY